MTFGKYKLQTTRSGVMQILSKFCHNKHLTRQMAPHTITHCITVNDDTSFLRESRDIKYHIHSGAIKNVTLNFCP